jgi:hypothetical protein
MSEHAPLYALIIVGGGLGFFTLIVWGLFAVF